MKKATLVSSVIFILALVTFALINTQSSLAVKSDVPTPQNTVVWFYIHGCDNCNIGYCINGGEQKFSSSCSFKEELPNGTYTICVKCQNNKIGTATFVVSDATVPPTVDIKMRPANGEDCACTNSKK